MKDISGLHKMHPFIMIRPFQNVPEGTKSRPIRYSLILLRGILITISLLKMILSPQLKKTSQLNLMRSICPISNPMTIHQECLCQNSYGKNSHLRTGTSSMCTTRRFLPNLGHHNPVVPKPYQMIPGLQMVENPETSFATKDKNQKPIHQIVLPMKQHLIKINSYLQWFMKLSMPLVITHRLILTKFGPSTEPTKGHLRHPTSSPGPRPTFHSTN